MSNILKVTTPTGGYDQNTAIRQGQQKAPDPSIQGQVNIDKVTRPDGRTDAGSQEHNVAMKFKGESNYNNFIQQMGKLSGMTETFSKFFFEHLAMLVESGLDDEFATKLGEFYAMIELSEKEVAGFVKNQQNTSVRFKGAFFELLRHVMQNTTSQDLKSDILDFLKRYVDLAENQHIMNKISFLLEGIEKRLFQSAAAELQGLMKELDWNAKPGSNGFEENATVLKEKILPHLNQYITTTHDRGLVRELVSVLSFYVARCENGTEARVVEAFEQLMKYQMMQETFQGAKSSMLLQVLANTEYEKSAKKQGWADKLSDLIRVGVSSAEGSDQKEMFKSLMQSIVLNESVYMPVLHMMLPMRVGEQLMFAEMWIDPDAGGKKSASPKDKTVQGLIKFDIQELGFFDLFFLYKEGKIKVQMNCPDKLSDELKQIREDMSRIFMEHQIRTEEIYVDVGGKSIPISTAFPKIFERKNSINVTI